MIDGFQRLLKNCYELKVFLCVVSFTTELNGKMFDGVMYRNRKHCFDHTSDDEFMFYNLLFMDNI